MKKKPIIVIFDLDYVLVSDICLVNNQPPNFDKIIQNVGEESIIESCGHYYYLYNGWKELIKYVMELTENNKLIFFSNGTKERNEDIITQMFEKILERDATDYVRDNVTILSKEHTIDTTKISSGDDVEKEKNFQPKGMYGQKKKDLMVAVGSKEKLKYTLLIDDDETYIIPGQEKNLLRINGQSATNNLCDLRYTIKKIIMPHGDDDQNKQKQKILPENISNYDSFLTLNKLFYAAGVLKNVYDMYSRVDRNLIDILWEDHGFKVDGHNDQLLFQSYELLKRFELYQSGLEVLREISNDVGFLISSSSSSSEA